MQARKTQVTEMCSAYLGAFTGSLEFSDRTGVHISALFDEEVGVGATQRTEGLFTAERRDELRLDYAMVRVVVKSVFSCRKYRASVNILNTIVGAKYLIPIVRTTQPHCRTGGPRVVTEGFKAHVENS
jgi:hypothetical protein